MSSLAIVTKYLGYTNFRESRIKATARTRKEYSDGMVSPALALTVHYDQGKSSEDNHTLAAKALAKQIGWSGLWVCGGLPDMTGNCYVRLPNDAASFVPWHRFGIENRDWFYVAEEKPE